MKWLKQLLKEERGILLYFILSIYCFCSRQSGYGLFCLVIMGFIINSYEKDRINNEYTKYLESEVDKWHKKIH